MTKSKAIVLAVAAAAAIGAGSPALAGDLAPLEARSIVVDGFTGVAYYTRDADALRLVTTLNAGDSVLRVVTALAEGQTLTFATPGVEGGSDTTIEFTRSGQNVRVSEPIGVALMQ